jgi:hypothetical protein
MGSQSALFFAGILGDRDAHRDPDGGVGRRTRLGNAFHRSTAAGLLAAKLEEWAQGRDIPCFATAASSDV